MAISAFIPELWSALMIRHLDKRLVYGQPSVANRDYEGEIHQAGDTVHLQNVNDVTTGTYKTSEEISYESPDVDLDKSLVIDQFKYWAIKVDDVNEAQSLIHLQEAKVARAAYSVADTIDQYVASFQSGVVTAGNVLQAAEEKPFGVTEAEDAYEHLVDLGVQLDEQNVPEGERFCVIPPWYHGLLLKDDRFVKAGTGATDQVLRNGQVGEAAGFTVLKSNNVPATEGKDYRILAGSNQGITLAEQLVVTEALRAQGNFADLVRGLHVYGATLANPDELAVLKVSKS